MTLEIFGVEGLPEVSAGADLARLVADRVALHDGDVVVVTSKAVSKAEGRLRAGDRDAAVDAESVRLVAARPGTRIVETRHGFVLANAGVDASNVPPGRVALLPEDADASARRLRDRLRELTGVSVAVVVSDTFGRPWRRGLVDVAVGAAGIAALRDYRGQPDTFGVPLNMTEMADVDELASAAELVKGKTAAVPVAVVRGFHYGVDDAGVRPLVRPAAEDLFRLGTAEAVRAAAAPPAGFGSFPPRAVDPAAVRRAVDAVPDGPPPVLFTVVPAPAMDALGESLRAADDDGFALVAGAPVIVVAWLGAADAGGRDSALVREGALVAAGARVAALLVALAGEGLAGAWAPVGSTMAPVLRDVVAGDAGGEPVALLGVGHRA